MSLTIYHLHFSQADRIIWLCEELTYLIPTFKYDLKVFPRGLETSEGKRTLLSLHPSGTSPTIVDTLVHPSVTMTESQAIMEYIINVHGQGHFKSGPKPGQQPYLSANLQAAMIFDAYDIKPDDAKEKVLAVKVFLDRTQNHLAQYEAQLSRTRYLAGDEFTAADMMNIYGLTTMRAIYPVDISGFPCLLRYLEDITGRTGYKRYLEMAEEGMPALVMGQVPRFDFEVLLSMKSWRSVMDDEGNAVVKKDGVE